MRFSVTLVSEARFAVLSSTARRLVAAKYSICSSNQSEVRCPMSAGSGVDPGMLSKVPLFEGLTSGQLEKVASSLRPMSFPAHRDIMMTEQPGEAVYIILSGTLKVHVEQADGRDVILALLGPGQTVGEMSI